MTEIEMLQGLLIDSRKPGTSDTHQGGCICVPKPESHDYVLDYGFVFERGCPLHGLARRGIAPPGSGW